MEDHLIIHHPTEATRVAGFARDVAHGLTSDPKSLSPQYFYDAVGSHLFEAITQLPEYYLTGAESEILESHGDEIVREVDRPAVVSELGSGSSSKTRLLIEAILRERGSLLYRPIDISESALRASAEGLLQVYPGLRIEGYVADYATGLEAIRRSCRKGRDRVSVKPERRAGAIHDDPWTGRTPDSTSSLVLFLGSTIGNLDAEQARELLVQVRRTLDPGGFFLLGIDMKKPEDILVRAYDDPTGVTAAFNRNLLGRINRELEGEFDPGLFEHRAVYNSSAGAVEMHLVSRVAQGVRIGRLDLTIEFRAGESIHTENSYKFELEQMRTLADQSGFRVRRKWLDSRGWFALVLLEAI